MVHEPSSPSHDMDDEDMPAVEMEDFPRPLGIENHHSLPFGELVSVFRRFEKMITETNKNKKGLTKRELLQQYFTYWREKAGPDMYPVIRLLLPERDTRRRSYNLKEQKLAKALVKAMGLPPNKPAAIQLLNWKVPTTKEEKNVGDFSTVAMKPIEARSTAKETRDRDMTMNEVNNLLDRLAQAGASHRSIVDRAANSQNGAAKGKQPAIQDQVADILEEAFEKLTPVEMKWLIRIILRDLKVGMSERVVLGAMHPDAVDLFNTCSDILRVCWELHDPKHRITDERKQMSVGSVFSPMLCGRLSHEKFSFAKVVDIMTAGRPKSEQPSRVRLRQYWCKPEEFLLEEKFDGERIQVHKKGDTYTYYSRKSTDYTHLYGANPDVGSITPFIHKYFRKGVEEAVLDGEMLVWDPQNSLYVPFGQLKSFAVKTSFAPDEPRPCLKIFDVLYIKTNKGKQSLLEVPLWHRKALIRDVIEKPVPGVLEIAEVHKINCADDVANFLKVMLEDRGEGLVVKNPFSPYVLGGRESTWLKIKPDYMDQLGHDLDALVIGAYWGQGRRGGGHASFMLGVKDPNGPVDADGTPYFRSFAKVGSGFDRELYAKIKDRTQGNWIKVDKYKLPKWFSTNAELPEQLIHPKDSFVVTVKAAEVVLGKDYGAGLALRFPRCMGVRDDKDWTDCATLQDLEALQGGSTKRTHDGAFVSEGKKKMTTRTSRPGAVAPVVRVAQTDSLFKGIVLYVHQLSQRGDRPRVSKDQVLNKIREHGGDYRQAISALYSVEHAEQRLVIASEWKGQLPNVPGIDEYDVLKPEWILDSIEAGHLVTKTAKYYVRMLDSSKTIVEASEQREKALAEGISQVEWEGEGESDRGPTPGPSESQNKDVEMEAEEAKEDGGALDEDDEELGGFRPSAMAIRDQSASKDDSDDDTEPDTEDEQRHDNESDDDSDDDDLDLAEDGDGDAAMTPPPASLGLNVDKLAVSDTPAKASRPSEDGLLEAHHDPDRLFGNYVAYFDTPENVIENGLKVSDKEQVVQDAAKERLLQAEQVWTANGGVSTTNLLEHKLTHIIVDAKVRDRMRQMIDLTSEPRFRHLVTPSWIHECVDSEDLVDENDFRA